MNDTPIEQTDTEPQEQEQSVNETLEESTTSESQERTDEGVDDFSLDIKYNKQALSLNREDAIKYAQMGKKYEALNPTLKQLEYLAMSDGKSLKDFVQATIEAIDAEREQVLKDKAGGDEEIFQALLAKDKADRGKAYDDMIASQKAKEEQEEQDEIKLLSQEFDNLKKQVPEFQDKQFESVPDKVLAIRNNNGISLYDAYLRYEYENAKSVEKEKQNQKDNALNSTGAVFGKDISSKPNWEKELLKGIWG